MRLSENRTLPSDQSKLRRPKTREVSSRFLSPTSPVVKPQNHILQDSVSIQRPCLPTKPSSSTKKDNRLETMRELENEKGSIKDNRRPSMRYMDKSSCSPLTSISANSLLIDDQDSVILPGRFSIDECALYRTSRDLESDSEFSDISSASNFSTSSLVRTPKPGIEVASKYNHEFQTRPSRRSPDCGSINNNSRKVENFSSIENEIKTKSITRCGNSMSRWALSPGRSGSRPASMDTKVRPMTFSRLKPPKGTAPRSKGVTKLLNFGLDFFKSKKSSSSSSSSALKLKSCDTETVHQLKLLHNQLIQWKFANARSDSVNKKLINQVENQLLCASDSLTKLGHSVLQRRIRLQKRRLELKLDHMLQSQMKHLETWEDMERQHLSALSMTKQCMHALVCKLPLVDGAKVDLQTISAAFYHATQITDSIESTVTKFSSSSQKSVPFLSELAEVAAREKLMLEQCHELLGAVSALEIHERSLKACIIQQIELQQKKQSETS